MFTAHTNSYKMQRSLLLLTAVLYPLFGVMNTYIIDRPTESFWILLERISFSALILLFITLAKYNSYIKKNFYYVISTFVYIGYSHLLYIGTQIGFDINHTIGVVLVLVGTSLVFIKSRHLNFYLAYALLTVSIALLIAPKTQLNEIATILIFCSIDLVLFITMNMKITAQHALQTSETNLQAILENTNDEIWSVDRNLNYLTFNTAYATAEAYNDHKPVIGNKVGLNRLTEDEKEQWLQNYKKALQGEHVMFLLEDPTKEKNTHEIEMFPIFEEKEIKGVSVFSKDITKRIENEKIYQKALKDKALAIESSRQKEIFLANMSHEIRTPMNAIFGLTNLLKKSLNLNQKESEYVKIIELNTKILLSHINSILDFSKVESGNIEIKKQTFHLKELMNEILLAQEEMAKKSQNKITLTFDSLLDQYYHSDPLRINQIISNLVSNAIKFTKNGVITLNIEYVNETNELTKVKFTVKDSGIGIPKESIPKIFDSFYQAPNSDGQKYIGTGLGLAITKKICETMQGSIDVTSEENKGTTFTVVLPLEKSKETKSEVQINPIKMSTTNNVNLSILIVEDNSFNQMVMEETLRDWNPNLKLTFAENGEIAIEKLQNNTYDIILMDIQMPIMDGHTATQKIRNELPEPQRNTPIIAVTAHAFKEEIENCYANGMNDYISKPFEGDELIEKILKHASIDSNTETKIQLVNRNQIFNFTKGNVERIAKMINMFLDYTPNELIELKEAQINGEIDRVRSLAHSFKPKFGYLGMEGLGEIAFEIEKLSEGDELNNLQLANRIDTLIQQTKEAIVELKELLESL
jgi:PAS domain S-box-containing protein